MITLRRAHERGHADHGWLDTWHTFSFADYQDPRHMGFRNLRVINDDSVAPAMGFGTHRHQDMEIVTYVLDGALQHKDSMGTGSIIRPGEVQRMSAGTGVFHSEFNASKEEAVHFLQIWMIPAQRGIAPGYEQKAFSADARQGQLKLVASPEGSDGSVTVHADARLYATLLAGGESVRHELARGRHGWVHVARGKVELNGHVLSTGDGAALTEEAVVALKGVEPSEVLVFDLA